MYFGIAGIVFCCFRAVKYSVTLLLNSFLINRWVRYVTETLFALRYRWFVLAS